VKPSLIRFEPRDASKINTPDAGELALITYLIVEPYSISVGEARPRYNSFNKKAKIYSYFY
jgi:hypothetical protein